MLTDDQLLQYSRQIMLPQVDIAGQEAICAGKVLIVGLGGLGCPAALYLASAGVGTLILVDHDTVELSNLQRQIAHQVKSIGLSKVDSAETAIAELAPNCTVEKHAARLTENNVSELVAKADVVLDCSDNFSTRFMLNRACVESRVPLVSGAAIRMEGQVAVYDVRDAASPCYRCLYDDTGSEDLNCSTNGVLAPVVGIIGSIQATEALKLLAGVDGTLVGRLQILDAQQMEWRTLKLSRDETCPVCSAR